MNQAHSNLNAVKVLLKKSITFVALAAFLSYISLFLSPASLVILYFFPFWIVYGCIYFLIVSISKLLFKRWEIKSSPAFLFWIVVSACYGMLFISGLFSLQDFIPHGLSALSISDIREIAIFFLPLFIPPVGVVIRYILNRIKF
jgi:hypothetical protein